ncbi:hypothetical protein JTE90_004300 [Oedothorax gibbosus]|uniref:Uncharacterized protein n=1 Tax=Oedothorax gibbosus TaxID=931172 RepID=A0AAV6VLU7_9ARAC|nr:hypothetical protein JTE90_004300 [Oedothorax gibbosus]
MEAGVIRVNGAQLDRWTSVTWPSDETKWMQAFLMEARIIRVNGTQLDRWTSVTWPSDEKKWMQVIRRTMLP